MNNLILWGLLFLGVSCNKNTVSDISKFNPMDPMIDAIDKNLVGNGKWDEDFQKLVNDHRIEIGLRPFNFPDDLTGLAFEHSVMMAQGLVPFGSEGSQNRCLKLKLIYPSSDLCGEMVARGAKSPQEVFKAWMAVASQKEKIESKRYTESGLGLFQSADGKYFWTEIFLEVK